MTKPSRVARQQAATGVAALALIGVGAAALMTSARANDATSSPAATPSPAPVARMLGISLDELTDVPPDKLQIAEDLAASQAAAASAARTREPQTPQHLAPLPTDEPDIVLTDQVIKGGILRNSDRHLVETWATAIPTVYRMVYITTRHMSFTADPRLFVSDTNADQTEITTPKEIPLPPGTQMPIHFTGEARDGTLGVSTPEGPLVIDPVTLTATPG